MINDIAEYVGSIPKSIPAGKFLFHNDIKHGPKSKPGTNGFRAMFLSALNERHEECSCGWSGLKHYRLKEFTWKSSS